jgi:hypothetical protein
MPKQSPNLSTANSILTQESGPIPMNHKKCEKVREIDDIGGDQPDLAGQAATFLSQRISFQVANQRTRQPRSIPAKGGNRIARSALCGGKLKTLPR